MIGYANLNECSWELLTYDSVLAYRTRKLDAGLSAATVNMHISAIRMMAKQAWLKHMMPIETYGAIKEVKAVRGSRLPSGRALSQCETRNLIEASGYEIGLFLNRTDGRPLAIFMAKFLKIKGYLARGHRNWC